MAKEEFEELSVPETVPDKINNYLYQPHNAKAGSAAKLVESL